MPALKEANREEVEAIFKEQKIKPAVIKGTTIVRFATKPSDKYDFINVDQLYQLLEKNNLSIWASGSYLLVRKKTKE